MKAQWLWKVEGDKYFPPFSCQCLQLDEHNQNPETKELE